MNRKRVVFYILFDVVAALIVWVLFYLYRRMSENDEVIVVLNGVDKQNDVDMSRYTEIVTPGDEYIDILTGRTIVLNDKHGSMRSFAPREILILQKK